MEGGVAAPPTSPLARCPVLRDHGPRCDAQTGRRAGPSGPGQSLNRRLTLSRRWIERMASAKTLATLMTLQQGAIGSVRWPIVSVMTSSLIGLSAILAAEPLERTPCETQAYTSRAPRA